MALKKSAYALGQVATPVAVGCEVVTCRAFFALTADLAVGDIIQLMDLPAGHVPVDMTLDNDALAAGTVSVALLNAGLTDIDTALSGGAAWLTGAAVTAAGSARADAAGLRAMSRLVPNQSANQPVGIKIVTDTTAVTGIIGVTLFYRSA